MKKEDSVSLMIQATALPLFFAISYIIQGKLYLSAIDSAHRVFGDLMLTKSQVFITEYWLHILPRYIIPMFLLSLIGAACSNLLWTKRNYVFFIIMNFIFWPKVKMDSPELSFTIFFFAVTLISSALMPPIFQNVLGKIKSRSKQQIELDDQNLESLESA